MKGDKKDSKELKEVKVQAEHTGGEYIEMNINSDEFNEKVNNTHDSQGAKPFSVTVRSNRSNKERSDNNTVRLMADNFDI
jgi:hypothetical protein